MFCGLKSKFYLCINIERKGIINKLKIKIMTTIEKLNRQFDKLNKEYVKISKQMDAIAMTECTWNLEEKLDEIQNQMCVISNEIEKYS